MRGTLPSAPLQVGITPALKALVWDVFFASRGRGISLAAHLPWLDDTTGVHGLWLPDASAPGRAGAALVIRERTPSADGAIGLIGLVCVHESLRGQGWSKRLLHEAIALGQASGLSDLVLWTGKPEVYTHAGFAAVDQDVFVSATAAPVPPSPPAPLARQPVSCALPPFATAAWQSVVEDAQITWLEGPSGITLADWRGSPAAVVDLISRALPASWHVNVSAQDPLLKALAHHGLQCKAQPGPWRMRRRLSETAACPLPPIPFLERI